MGSVSWSVAELLARVAKPADEARWLERAQCLTVRQVRVLVAEAMHDAKAMNDAEAMHDAKAMNDAEAMHDAKAMRDAEAGEGSLESSRMAGADEVCTLTCTVDREDAWLFEATRCLLEQLGECRAVDQCDALLAEAQGTLLALLPRGGVELNRMPGCAAAQRDWLQQLQRWRGEAEVLCEQNILRAAGLERPARSESAPALRSLVIEASLGMARLDQVPATALDREVRSLAAALARHELELSRLALRLHRADGWRRLGYASEAQYARERLGLSCSSLRSRRTLALRLERLPRVTAALASAHIGVEGASQLVRIATAKTEGAWVERARERTIKHLREEVAAALVAVRFSGERDCPPPADTELAAFQSLEQRVVSGRFALPPSADTDAGASGAAPSGNGAIHPAEPVSEERKAWWQMLCSLAVWVGAGCQTSAVGSSPAPSHSHVGRVTLRLRMSREAYSWWHGLEAQARRWLPAGVSWLRFLCLSVWHGWAHLLGADDAYRHIYIRDRYRCTSPVCNRRDVTPHHLRFRSAGGSDDDDNVASICSWCHLHGVHGGRIRARDPPHHIHWELGPRNSPCLVVHGRERRAA